MHLTLCPHKHIQQCLSVISHIHACFQSFFPKTMGQAGLLYGRLYLMLWCLGRALAFPETASMLRLTGAVDH